MSPTEKQTWMNVVSDSSFLKGCHVEKCEALVSVFPEDITETHSPGLAPPSSLILLLCFKPCPGDLGRTFKK